MTICTGWSLLTQMCDCILFYISMWEKSGGAALCSIKFSLLSYYFKINFMQSNVKNKAFFLSSWKLYPKLLLYIRHSKNCMSKSLNIRTIQIVTLERWVFQYYLTVKIETYQCVCVCVCFILIALIIFIFYDVNNA